MPRFDANLFARTVENIREKALAEGRLLQNPTDAVLRKITEKEEGVKRTRYGSLVAHGEPTSRAAMFTKNNIDNTFGKVEEDFLEQCEKVLGQ